MSRSELPAAESRAGGHADHLSAHHPRLRHPPNTAAPHLDGVLRLKQAVAAHGAVAAERLLLAAVLVEELERHAGVAGHAVERVHAQAAALRRSSRGREGRRGLGGWVDGWRQLGVGR